MTKNKLAFLKALSTVTGNLSVAWFGLAIVTPNFTKLSTFDSLAILTKDILFGIFMFAITILIERELNQK